MDDNSSDRFIICAPSTPVSNKTAKEKLISIEEQNIKNVYQQNGNLISVNIQNFPSQNQTKQGTTNLQTHSPVEKNSMKVPKIVTRNNPNLIYVNVNNQLNSTMELNRHILRNTDTMVEVNPAMVQDIKNNTIKNTDVDLDNIFTFDTSAKSPTNIDIKDNDNNSQEDPNLMMSTQNNTNTIIKINVDPDPISTLKASSEFHTINDITVNENNSRQDPDVMIVNIEDNEETETIIDLTENEDTVYEIVNSKNKIAEIVNRSLLTDDDILCEKYYNDMSELAEMNEATSEINIDYLLNDINIEEIVKALNINTNNQSQNNDGEFVKASTSIQCLESSTMNHNPHTSEPSDTGEKFTCVPITQSETCNLSQSNEKLKTTPSSQTVKNSKLHTSNHAEKLATSTSSQHEQGQNRQIWNSRNDGENLPAAPGSKSDTDITSNCKEKLNTATTSQLDMGNPSNHNVKLNAEQISWSSTDSFPKFKERLNVAPTSLSEKSKSVHKSKTLNTAEKLTTAPTSQSITICNISINNPVKNSTITWNSLPEKDQNSYVKKVFRNEEEVIAALSSQTDTDKPSNFNTKLFAATTLQSDTGKPFTSNEKLNAAPTLPLENGRNEHTNKKNVHSSKNTVEKVTAPPRLQQIKDQKLHKSKSVNTNKKQSLPSSQPIKDQIKETNNPFHSGEKSTIGANLQPGKNSDLHTSKPYNIDIKLASSPSSQQKRKFVKTTIHPRSQTTTVANMFTKKSIKYNSITVKDRNQHLKSSQETQISINTTTQYSLQKPKLLAKFEKKKINTPKHSNVCTTAKQTKKKDSLITVQNNHQVITKDKHLEMNQKTENNSEDITHIKNKSNTTIKSNFGAIVNSKMALKNYIIPKIRKHLGQNTLLKTKPNINNIDFAQSHVTPLINTNLNKENKCKDEQSGNSYCELSLIRDEINKLMSCRNECASFEDIKEDKLEKFNKNVCKNPMTILSCNDKNTRLYESELGEKNTPRNDRKRKLIEDNEKGNVGKDIKFKLKKFEKITDVKNQNSIDTKGGNKIIYNFDRTQNTKTNANKIGDNKINVESKEYSENVINLEDIKSDTPKNSISPKEVRTSIMKKDVKLLNEKYATRRDNETNNPTKAKHQHSDEKTSSEDRQPDFSIENVTMKDNTASTIKTIISLRSLQNEPKNRYNGTYNKNNTRKEESSISHKEFIALDDPSRKDMSSVKPPCATDKERNSAKECFGKITYQENSRVRIINQNILNNNTEDISAKIDVKSNLDTILHSSLVGRYNIDCILHKGQHSYILKARNKNDNRIVAVKILLKMSFLENRHIEILKKLTDANNAKYFSCTEIEDIFWARYWYITMEYYPLNLIQALESCATGFSINKVQELSQQLLTALLMLRVTEILHTDIKPSHILINAEYTKLKLTGFDKAMYGKVFQVSPHIGTLNYRSPEIILGINIGYPADVWSTACTMFEMATKRKLFAGGDNRSVLENIMYLKGISSDQILSEGIILKDSKWKKLKSVDILSKLFNAYNSSIDQSTNECRKIIMFSDLLDKMLTLNHSERKTVELAYVHPFIYKL